MERAEVALLSSKSYGEKSKRAVKQAVELIGGIENVVRPEDTVLIKPNLVNIRGGESGNVTHFSMIEPIVELCYSAGAKEIFVGDGSGNADTPEAFKWSGMKGVVDRLRSNRIPVKFVDLNYDKNPDTGEFDAINLGTYALNSNHIYRIAHTVLKSDVIISVPKLKSHDGTGVTIALKNMIGIAPGGYYGFPKKGGNIEALPKSRMEVLPHGSSYGSYDLLWRTILDLNRIALGEYPGSLRKRRYLAVVDGVVAGAYDDINSTFELPLWRPVKVGVIIAGVDPVAVDTVSARVMCSRPGRIPTIVHASEKGLGRMDDIEILGERVEDVRKFVPPSDAWLKISDTRILQLWPKVVYRLFRKNAIALANKPSVHGVIKKIGLTRRED